MTYVLNSSARLTLNFGSTSHSEIEQCEHAILLSPIKPRAPLIIAFGAWNQHGPGRFEWWGVLQRVYQLTAPFNLILIRDKHNSWYQRGIEELGADATEVAHSLHALIQQIEPSQVITLGASMGAYAAMLWGALLKVNAVLAFAPLATLEPATLRALGEWRWLNVMDALAANPPRILFKDLPALLNATTSATEFYVLYGHALEFNKPNLDPKHAELLGQASNVYLHCVSLASHAIAYQFKQHGMLEPLLLELLERNFALTPPQDYARYTPRQRRQIQLSWLARAQFLPSIQLETRYWIAEELSAGKTPAAIFNALIAVGWPEDVILEGVYSSHYWWRQRQSEGGL